MAMNLNAAKTAIETAIKDALQTKYPFAPPGNPTVAADFAGLADGISPGIIAALQHILDNAQVQSHATII